MFAQPKTSADLLNLIYSNGENQPATIVFHEDGGHGWLQVPKKLVAEMGIAPKISKYSYMDKDNAYLEEDCDLATFIITLGLDGQSVQKLWELTPQEYNDYSPVRRLSKYAA